MHSHLPKSISAFLKAPLGEMESVTLGQEKYCKAGPLEKSLLLQRLAELFPN